MEVVGCCPVLYPRTTSPSGLGVYTCGSTPADVDTLRLAFGLCSVWLLSWMQLCIWCPMHNLLPLQSTVAALQSPLDLVNKSYDGSPVPCCCHSPAEMLHLLWWCRVELSPCCQVPSVNLAQLPSAGLLQIFTMAFKSERNKVHKAVRSQGKDFFSEVSQGQVHYMAWSNASGTTLHYCPKTSAVKEKGISELAGIQY